MNKNIKILFVISIVILVAGFFLLQKNKEVPTGVFPTDEREEITDKLDSIMK